MLDHDNNYDVIISISKGYVAERPRKMNNSRSLKPMVMDESSVRTMNLSRIMKSTILKSKTMI